MRACAGVSLFPRHAVWLGCLRARYQHSGAALAWADPGPAGRPTMRTVPRTKPERGGDARVSRSVPWIFRNEVANVPQLRDLKEKSLLVNVENAEGRELGAAVCNLQKGGKTGVNIFARMVSSNVNVVLDQKFFADRIRRAMRHRQQVFGSKSLFYRLLNGEGDEAPGVVCDRFGDVLCVQFTAAAVEEMFKEIILDALEEVLSPSAIIVRSDACVDRQLEMMSVQLPYVARGSYSNPTILPSEDGFVFEIDLLAEVASSGRFFEECSQRELVVQEFLRRRSSGDSSQRVLGLFSESLGLACAARGARTTFSGGAAESAWRPRIDALAAKHSYADRVEHVSLDASQSSSLSENDRASFDIVTLEPPALAPTYGKLEDGMQQYTAWVALAAAATRPHGLLLVVCRSRTMNATRLIKCVNLGIWSAQRQAALIHREACAPMDFPVHLALPGTNGMQVLGLRMR